MLRWKEGSDVQTIVRVWFWLRKKNTRLVFGCIFDYVDGVTTT